jgi:hypothetical protein
MGISFCRRSEGVGKKEMTKEAALGELACVSAAGTSRR